MSNRGRTYRALALAALVPLLALGLMGFSLAHWDDEVQVTGSVSMGVFNVTMSLDDYYDNETTLDVGSISASIVDFDDGDDTDGGVKDKLEVTISNVYPGYSACVVFNIENEGTIPAKTSFPPDEFEFTASFDWETYKQYFIFNLSYVKEDGEVLLMHLGDDGGIVYDYDFENDPEGILFLNASEAQYFKACFGLEAGPVNAPEDLMDQTISFELNITWIQAVP